MDGIREDVSRLGRQAANRNRELIAVVTESPAGDYIALGSVSREWEVLSLAELEQLREALGEALLIVRAEEPLIS